MKTPTPSPFLPCKYLRLFTPLPVFRHGNTQEYESHISNQLQISPCVNILDSLTHFHFPVSSHLLPPPEFTGIWNPKLDLPWISNETAWIKLFSGQNHFKTYPKKSKLFYALIYQLLIFQWLFEAASHILVALPRKYFLSDAQYMSPFYRTYWTWKGYDNDFCWIGRRTEYWFQNLYDV